MFNWFRDLFKPRRMLTCTHLFWPEMKGGRVVGRSCSTCGKYETMSEVHRRRRVK